MTLVFILTATFLWGDLCGWCTCYLWNERQLRKQAIRKQQELAERADDKNLQQVMSETLAVIDSSAKQIYELYHPAGCECTYCEIKNGGIDKGDVSMEEALEAVRSGNQYHPDFVRALMTKNKNLQAKVKELTEAVDKRDRERAQVYSRWGM